jgi:hypothetical protein
MTHKQIHRFQVNGIIGDDAGFVRLKNQYETILTLQMRKKGYVRVLDIDPAFSVEYDNEKDTYNFTFTMHGVYVGKARACRLDGISQGKLIPRPTPHHKLKQLLNPQE